MLSQVISAQLQMHNIRQENMQEENEELNKTSRTVEEEEARVRAEQLEVRKQMFINVQPYIC